MIGASALSLALLASPPEACGWIELSDDPDRSVEELSYTAEAAQIEGLFARVVDRLESRGCLERAVVVLEILERRLAELAKTGEDVAQLQARVELARLRVELRAACPELACSDEAGVSSCAAVEPIADFVAAHDALEPAAIEAWFAGDQPDRRLLACVLAHADQPAAPDLELGPDLTPDPSRDLGSAPATDPTAPRDTPPTKPKLEGRTIGLAVSSVGAVLGVAAMVTGGVFLAIDERCPGGGAPDSCQLRYSTTEEGILALSLGGAAVVASGIGLTFSLRKTPQSTPAGASAWTATVGWSARF